MLRGIAGRKTQPLQVTKESKWKVQSNRHLPWLWGSFLVQLQQSCCARRGDEATSMYIVVNSNSVATLKNDVVLVI